MTDVAPTPAAREHSRTGLSADALQRGILDHLRYCEVGAENFFLFGLTVDEVQRVTRDGYQPAHHIAGNPELATALESIADGTFSRGDTEVFRPLVDNLRFDDPFLVLADYASYVECQGQVGAAWQDTGAWTRMSIRNTARSGKFSSDRAITEYCDEMAGRPGDGATGLTPHPGG